ncbi:ABC transporter permease [Leeia sp. TBRC 13508]|uniref:Autoinducer 2 import system permease protein LsrD n=1 Tax=Leeia speluncae TaxID=2884804 RepID=A0ABS8D4D6_9NEIS|nr:ABC transporter permease [Leeia speluncae]MCB6183074.1 ABC transporter permease [Leeia speluncae]
MNESTVNKPTAMPWVISGPKTLFRWGLKIGVLPIFLGLALIVFGSLSDQFLTVQNFINLLRQSVYLILVSLGQMLVLISGGFDLSVGTVLAITSVVSSMTMSYLSHQGFSPEWVIALGCLAGLVSAFVVGSLNGMGVSLFKVSPFIMTMGVQSIGFGFALYLTGGVPVSGLPSEFGDVFGFGDIFGMPAPVFICVVGAVLVWLLMERTAAGRHLHAVGGNARAAELSGIRSGRMLMMAYVLCAGLAAIAGLLLTARTGSGEANIGGTVALESIAACVIGGVSLRGGIGKTINVVLGAIFIVLVQNGMNIANIGSYLQMVVLGGLLIIAVITDQLRQKYLV